ncbi:myocardial zonula adherens protein-like [Leptonychotes weddellii]|uniref:Myocardial zonula adherens protein-like n=1 Tax=Leptonychotes weddellii TaxID=9713 RepID=A0A7F8RQV2_LEPWE|nr:myocardial zonula adherens protein-like [Leptonychotes weddellii]
MRLKHPDLSNGEPTRKLPQGVVYGVVRRSDPNEQKEMVVYGWSTNQLKEEMNYIRDIESLKKKVQQKQLLILQLLEKISFLEGENNELQSRLDYLTETQAKPEVETREIGVGCDLLPSPTGRTREISMPSRNYTPYTRVLELTMKKTLT